MIIIEKHINSITDIYSITEKIKMQLVSNGQLSYFPIYRGEAKWEYELRPSIIRKKDNIEALKEIEQKSINDFFNELKGQNFNHKIIQEEKPQYKFQNEWLLLQQAQHYGLPTRLLDWTQREEVALYFAVENQENDDSDGQFWIFIKPDLMTETEGSNNCYLNKYSPFETDSIKFINPSREFEGIANQRMLNQFGNFLIQPTEKLLIPLEQQDEFKNQIIKIKIPKESKKRIRKELSKTPLQEKYTHEYIYVREECEIREIVKKIRNKYDI
jgi:hypothetical protein